MILVYADWLTWTHENFINETTATNQLLDPFSVRHVFSALHSVLTLTESTEYFSPKTDFLFCLIHLATYKEVKEIWMASRRLWVMNQWLLLFLLHLDHPFRGSMADHLLPAHSMPYILFCHTSPLHVLLHWTYLNKLSKLITLSARLTRSASFQTWWFFSVPLHMWWFMWWFTILRKKMLGVA